MSRMRTVDEVRDEFLHTVWDYIDYWNRVDNGYLTKERLAGLAFSILVILDGESVLPGFEVIPSPHHTDKQYHIDREEDWYPCTDDVYERRETGQLGASLHDFDIAGGLHERFYNMGRS